MPKVPIARAGQVTTRALPAQRVATQAPVQAFGGGQGAVTQAAAGLIGAVGSLVQQEIDKANKSKANNAIDQGSAGLRNLLRGERDEQGNVIDPGYLNQSGQNAFATKEDYLNRKKKLLDELEEGLSNDSQKEMFRESRRRMELDYDSSMQNHESRQYQVVTDADYKSSILNIKEDIAANFLEPNKIDEGLARLKDRNNTYADIKGLTPEAREALQKTSESSAHASVVIQNLNNNRDVIAKEYLEANQANMTVDDVRRTRNMFERKQQKLTKIRARSPWEYFNEVGDLERGKGFAPVNFNDPDSIEQRSIFIEGASKRNKFDPAEVTFLSPAEEQAVMKSLSSSNSQQATSFLRSVTLNSSPEVMRKVSSQLFKKDPGIGIAMAISGDDFEAANQIVAGRRLLIDEKQKGTATGGQPLVDARSKEVQEVFDSVIGNSIEDPNLRVRMREAVYYHYFKGQFDANEDLASFDEDKFKESFEAVQGEMADINDRKVFSFRIAGKPGEKSQFVEPDELEDTVDDFNDEFFMATHKDVPRTLAGESFNIENATDRVHLKSVADGKYQMEVDGKVLLNEKGGAFIVDMRDMVKYRRKNKKSLTDTVMDFFK